MKKRLCKIISLMVTLCMVISCAVSISIPVASAETVNTGTAFSEDFEDYTVSDKLTTVIPELWADDWFIANETQMYTTKSPSAVPYKQLTSYVKVVNKDGSKCLQIETPNGNTALSNYGLARALPGVSATGAASGVYEINFDFKPYATGTAPVQFRFSMNTADGSAANASAAQHDILAAEANYLYTGYRKYETLRDNNVPQGKIYGLDAGGLIWYTVKAVVDCDARYYSVELYNRETGALVARRSPISFTGDETIGFLKLSALGIGKAHCVWVDNVSIEKKETGDNTIYNETFDSFTDATYQAATGMTTEYTGTSYFEGFTPWRYHDSVGNNYGLETDEARQSQVVRLGNGAASGLVYLQAGEDLVTPTTQPSRGILKASFKVKPTAVVSDATVTVASSFANLNHAANSIFTIKKAGNNTPYIETADGAQAIPATQWYNVELFVNVVSGKVTTRLNAMGAHQTIVFTKDGPTIPVKGIMFKVPEDSNILMDDIKLEYVSPSAVPSGEATEAPTAVPTEAPTEDPSVTEAPLVTYDYIQSGKTGNIFANTDTITFRQNITNNTNETVICNCAWEITDESGSVVARKSGQNTLSAGGSTTRTIPIDNPGTYGIYTIHVTEESYTQADPNTKQETSYTEEFSVCISLDDTDVDQSFGFNQAVVRGFGDIYTAGTLMHNAGGAWNRESIPWQGVESTKGVYNISDANVAKLRKMKQDGINVVAVLTGRNELYGDGGTSNPYSNADIEAFAAYCAYCAVRLDGVVDHFEIWNEWNSGNYNPTGRPASDYAKLLKASYTAIKEANPDAVVIGLDTAGIVGDNNTVLTWIGNVLDALNDGTGNKYMDAISVHCYDYDSTNGFPEAQFITNVQTLKALLATKGYGDLPLWLTEVGFSTYSPANPEFFVEGCTKDTQLNSLVMMNAVTKAYGLFDTVLEYCFYDSGNLSNISSNWGLVNCWKRDYVTDQDLPEGKLTPSGAKPSYLGLAAMNYFIGGNATFQYVVNEGRSYGFEFYNENLGKNVMLAMNGGLNNNSTQVLELGCTSVNVYDKYGNFTETLTSPMGTYSVNVGSEPIYIVGDFYSEPTISVTQNDEEVTSISDVSSGDTLSVNLSGFVTSSGQSPVVLMAQYQDGCMIDFVQVEAEFSDIKNEFTTEFTVMSGADCIKVMCWDMNELNPYSSYYEIN